MMNLKCSLATSLCLVSVLLSGCGTSATIAMKSGHLVEGQIVAGDRNAIYLDNGEGEVTVPRKSIVDVDHPGNGAAITGLLLTVYGGLNIAVGLPECDKRGPAFCTGVFLPTALGLALTGYGFSVWGASLKAFNSGPQGRALSQRFIGPTYLPSGGSKAPGLVFVSTF